MKYLLIAFVLAGCSTSIIEPWSCECECDSQTMNCRGIAGETITPIWER